MKHELTTQNVIINYLLLLFTTRDASTYVVTLICFS